MIGVALSGFRATVRIRHPQVSKVEETLLFHIEVTVVKVPTWVKPGIWGAVVGAPAIMIVGFWQMGSTTVRTADRMVGASPV